MSNLTSVNSLLSKHYGVSINFDGLADAIERITLMSENDSDGILENVKICTNWERKLSETSSVVAYYLSMFENKEDFLSATLEMCKSDIKNGTLDCIALARKCKIEETEPEKIKYGCEWKIKCNKEEIKILKNFIAYCDSYSKFFKGNYFSCLRRYNKVRSSVYIGV